MAPGDVVKIDTSYEARAEGGTIGGVATTISEAAAAELVQGQTYHSSFALDPADADNPLTIGDHVFVKFSRDNAVAGNFAGSVMFTAYELISINRHTNQQLKRP